MESRSKVIDTFQIIGFAVSTGVTIVLMIAKVDPVQSTVIGLMLAILTQLFDLQLRHSSSEERVLQANALSRALYHDPGLLSKVRQMVEDYYSIKSGWFDLFKMRAEDALSECHSTLRSMADGTMEPSPHSEYTLSVMGFRLAQTSLKQVTDFSAIKDAVEGMRGWYVKSWGELAKRGVRVTMILVVSPEALKETLPQMHTMPMLTGAYIALADELPSELDENYLIVDDRAVAFHERRADGTLDERTVSIIPIEVERMVKRFDQVLRRARRVEDVLAEANAKVS